MPKSDTQWKPGQSGNPKGKPKGAKHAFSEAFVKALADDFRKEGIAAIKKVREEKPESYLSTIAKILPKEIDLNGDVNVSHSDESVSETAGWVKEMLGATKTSKAEKPRTH